MLDNVQRQPLYNMLIVKDHEERGVVKHIVLACPSFVN